MTHGQHSLFTIVMVVVSFVAGVYSERANERRRVATILADSDSEYLRRNLRCVDEADETVCRWRRLYK